MNLDKHDLFRNAVPGFVFLVVILSFYAVTQSLDQINSGQSALLGLVAGFPLGFIIHSLYRIIFHVELGEQASIDDEAATLIKKLFKGSNREKAHYLMFQMCRSENHDWKERIDFLYSYIHALGASVLAIALALIFMFAIKYPLFCVLCCLNSPISLRVSLTAIIWVAVAIIFYYGRKKVKDTCRVSTKIFYELQLAPRKKPDKNLI